MKLKDKQNLQGKTVVELKNELVDTQKALGRAVLERKMGKHTNLHVAKDLRKKSAVIQTIMRQKQLEVKA